MQKRYLALCSAIVDIADGASYLFGIDNPKPSSVFEKQEHLKQLLESIDIKPWDGDMKYEWWLYGDKKTETVETGEKKRSKMSFNYTEKVV